VGKFEWQIDDSEVDFGARLKTLIFDGL